MESSHPTRATWASCLPHSRQGPTHLACSAQHLGSDHSSLALMLCYSFQHGQEPLSHPGRTVIQVPVWHEVCRVCYVCSLWVHCKRHLLVEWSLPCHHLGGCPTEVSWMVAELSLTDPWARNGTSPWWTWVWHSPTGAEVSWGEEQWIISGIISHDWHCLGWCPFCSPDFSIKSCLCDQLGLSVLSAMGRGWHSQAW